MWRCWRQRATAARVAAPLARRMGACQRRWQPNGKSRRKRSHKRLIRLGSGFDHFIGTATGLPASLTGAVYHRDGTGGIIRDFPGIPRVQREDSGAFSRRFAPSFRTHFRGCQSPTHRPHATSVSYDRQGLTTFVSDPLRWIHRTDSCEAGRSHLPASVEPFQNPTLRDDYDYEIRNGSYPQLYTGSRPLVKIREDSICRFHTAGVAICT